MNLDRNILIVDDIWLNRQLLIKLLRNKGFNIIEAENGREAIEKLINNDIDCILIDIEMPVMNGIETAEFIRNQLPFPKCKTKLIAVTAHPKEEFADYFGLFDDILSKPFSEEKIYMKLSHC